jgi:RimJ/RimL family protein N-acetyltransferase
MYERPPNPAARTLVLEDTSAAPSASPPSSAGSDVTVRSNLLRHLGVAARLAAPIVNSAAALSIRTPRLLLRPLELHDSAEFFRVVRLSRRHLEEFCPLSNREPTEAPESDEDLFERQLAMARGAAATGRAWRAFAFDSDRRIVGAFNINDITRGLEHTGELVFWLSADATRRGYAIEGVRATVEHALRDLPGGIGLCRVVALVAPGNEPCLRLIKKSGFSLDTTAPLANLRLNGRDVPHSVFEIFAKLDPIASIVAAPHVGVVEGKPSIAQALFGRGLLSILRTESEPHASLE